MAKRFKYTSRIKPETQSGMAATVMAVISALLLVAAIIVAFVFKGAGGNYLGAIGLTGLLLAVVGFFIGLKSFSEKEKSHRFSTIAGMANGIIAVIWLALYLVGIR